MGLFSRKKKEEISVPKKLVSTIKNNIAEFRCPHCNHLITSGYYFTVKIPDINTCPNCNKPISK